MDEEEDSAFMSSNAESEESSRREWLEAQLEPLIEIERQNYTNLKRFEL